MIITDQFIFIHQPKTGGSFVSSALVELYGLKDILNVDLPDISSSQEKDYEFKTQYGEFKVAGEKHSLIEDVNPDLLETRELLGTIRNPLDLYVSQYEFGWWKRDEYLDDYKKIDGFDELFPNYPNLTFQEYLDLDYRAWNWFFNDSILGDKGFGMATVRFVKWFCRNRKSLLPKLSEIEWKNYDLTSDIEPIHFLKTGTLNVDLIRFLKKVGFSSSEIQFINEKKRVLPLGKGRNQEQKWQKYYTPELLETVLRKDKLIFDLFPEFIPKSL